MYVSSLTSTSADITAPPAGLLESVQAATRDAARAFALFAVAAIKAQRLYALAADFAPTLADPHVGIDAEGLLAHVRDLVARGSIDPADPVLAELGIG